MAARKTKKTLTVLFKSKTLLLAFLVVAVIAWIVQLPKVAGMLAPVLKSTPTQVTFYGEVVHTWAVSLFFAWLAFLTITSPIFAILFAAMAISIAYHGIRKFTNRK